MFRTLNLPPGPILSAWVLLLPAAALAVGPAVAASVGPVARVTEPVNEAVRTMLPGHLAPALRGSKDLGVADPAMHADRLALVLRGSPAQEAALDQFLHDVQTPGHKDFHRWLTPQSFAQRFGVAPADLARLRSWIESKGLRVDEMPVGGRSILLSGTLAQVDRAFGTRIHRYEWRGEQHLAASSNPTVPSAFAAVVRGFASLHDFRHRPALVPSLALPDFTSGGTNYLAPGDFAVLYDLNGSYVQGLGGSGRSIAVLGQSSIVATDLANFRSFSGLAANAPQIINNGAAPPLVHGDELESDLDLEWSAAVAPSATVKFVTSASTLLTDGVALSAQYAVANNVADIISVSYSSCEAAADVASGVPFYDQLWQQAAAQGTSVFVASGDWGAAACDDASGETSATQGLAVNQLCTSPYSTCVGGTQFSADVGAQASYWSSSNSSTNSSVLSYIGESVWNQSGANLYASGGGASIYYTKPAWQYAAGVPSDGRRDVPDVALAASAAHDPYLVYSSDGYSASTLLALGGTSAAAPSMAGMVALLAQKQGARLGSINPVLYGLSDLQQKGGASVFHRITSGNNSVPGQAGFSASTSDPSYNQASGLGSIDGGVLLASWNDYVAATAQLLPSTALVPAGKFIGGASLNLPSGTSWSANVNAAATAWLSVTPASGSGPAPLSYVAQANGGTVRSGIINVNGLTLTITQAAASGVARLTFTPAALVFGTTSVGAVAASQRVFVGNDGNAVMDVTNVAINGSQAADFTSAGTCTVGLSLAAGASCYLDIDFSPVASGGRSATLAVTSASGTASVPLSGTGASSTGAGPSGDVPMPPWAYGMLGSCLLGILLRTRRA